MTEKDYGGEKKEIELNTLPVSNSCHESDLSQNSCDCRAPSGISGFLVQPKPPNSKLLGPSMVHTL